MSLIPKPNFLIVGAAKAGTTSLYRYLKDHPEVYLPAKKEPLYFISESIKNQNQDKWMKTAIKNSKTGKVYSDNINDYLDLFKNVNNEKAIGEASATYLYYHEESIPRIKKELGDIKIIIILRNPIEKAFSQYKYLNSGNAEPYSLIKALTIEKERKEKNYCSLYHYVSQGLYYNQVKAFYDNFTNVKVILLDDLNKNIGQTMKTVCDFLLIDNFYSIQDPKIHNKTAFIPKSNLVNSFVNTKIAQNLRCVIKNIIPNYSKTIKKYYYNLNSKSLNMTIEERKMLSKYLYHDLLKLEEYLHYDLSIWKHSFIL